MGKCIKAKWRWGFSLIEMIGVLAVIAILAALLVPVVIRRVDQAARTRDAAELSGLASSLRSLILRTGQIPGASTLVSVLATNEMLVSSDQVALSSRGVPRAFLLDPSLWIGSANGQLPYAQTTSGTITNSGGKDLPGLNLRLMILSSLNLRLPTSIDFNTAWGTPDGSVPSGWPASWTNQGLDLHIQRINLEPLFHHVILINGAINLGGQGYFSINTNTSSPFPVPVVPSEINSYYLDGSVLGLYVINGTSTNLTAQEVIRNDLSRVFEYGVWRDQINEGTTNGVLSGLGAIAATFYTYAPPGGWTNNLNPSGGTPQAVFGLLNSFMNGYATWAAMQPCFSYSGTNIATYPPYEEIHDALSAFGNGADVVP